MNVVFSKRFEKNYKKRIKGHKNLEDRFKERFHLYVTDPQNPILKLHQLKGDKNMFSAFSITGDIRVIVSVEDNTTIFHDVGTHNQVYQ